MKSAFIKPLLCALLVLLTTQSARAQITFGCTQSADESSRVQTAQALLLVNASNYQSLINYWAEDIVYKEPVLTNTGRQEMLDYLSAVYSGNPFGFPNNKNTTIKDELYSTYPDGSMNYFAAIEWTGNFGGAEYIQTGMSIIKFRPGEGCPNFQRDYYSEGDTWWNIPLWQPTISIFRNVYISTFGLYDWCFDDDGDGYAKYQNSFACPNAGIDCNDFVADINPGATEIPGNGTDENCFWTAFD